MGIEKASSVDQRRAAMPVTAAFIDMCRTQYAAFVDVDAQLATALQAQREYTKVLEVQGATAARRWHLANADRCTFIAQENGRTVGIASPFGQNL
ncbi:MAG: hypothetical protein V4706_01840 [Pseudomonadota bacterium]